MATHSSTLAWKVPWTEEPGGLQSMGSLESDTTEWLLFHFSLLSIGEGNGNPLHCSCQENPRDGGAWWPAIYGVPQSRTQLKWLSSSNSSNNNIKHTAKCKQKNPQKGSQNQWKHFYLKILGEFPGGLVVRIQNFPCCGFGSNPGQRIEILEVVWCG